MNSSFITLRPDTVRYQPHAVAKPLNRLDFVWKNTINVKQPVSPQRADSKLDIPLSTALQDKDQTQNTHKQLEKR